ncbi:MAG: Fe-S cluster assembly protein SufD [Rhodomicrobium sp.]|nr:Fe-S cluster assembly protein SufD [Rhodomicrobium sp.]
MNMPAMNIETAGEARLQDSAARQLLDHYGRVVAGLPGDAAGKIRELRNRAVRVFEEKGLPSRRVEEWKYTDLRRLMTEAYAPATGKAPPTTAKQIESWLGEAAAIDAVKLVFVNGAFDKKLSAIGDLPDGVALVNLADALHSPPNWLLETLSRPVGEDGDIVTLLNTAFMNAGTVLRIADGVILTKPFHLIHVAVGSEPLAVSVRTVIQAGRGAEASIIESSISGDGSAAQFNAVTQIAAGPGSKLRHYKVDDENRRAQHLASVHVTLEEAADYLAVNFDDGAALARHQTFLAFKGNGGRGHFYGAQLLAGRQHCDMTLVIDHDAVGCESREHVKAVLEDHAQGVFQAKVIVRPGAQKTDGRQMAQALILSENAEFDAKPELEIYADDVKCNHGATSGALDEDLMFYLRSRGIPKEEAKLILVQAFIGEILDKIELEPLREALVSKAARWLE